MTTSSAETEVLGFGSSVKIHILSLFGGNLPSGVSVEISAAEVLGDRAKPGACLGGLRMPEASSSCALVMDDLFHGEQHPRHA